MVAREQYLKIREAVKENQFLSQHLFIVRDLKILEEKLVEAGLLTPEEIFEMSAGQIWNRMDWATEIFYEITSNYYPELISPIHDKIINEVIP